MARGLPVALPTVDVMEYELTINNNFYYICRKCYRLTVPSAVFSIL
jgi:hypothetical protein